MFLLEHLLSQEFPTPLNILQNTAVTGYSLIILQAVLFSACWEPFTLNSPFWKCNFPKARFIFLSVGWSITKGREITLPLPKVRLIKVFYPWFECILFLVCRQLKENVTHYWSGIWKSIYLRPEARAQEQDTRPRRPLEPGQSWGFNSFCSV